MSVWGPHLAPQIHTKPLDLKREAAKMENRKQPRVLEVINCGQCRQRGTTQR